jgi:hypothetical protein
VHLGEDDGAPAGLEVGEPTGEHAAVVAVELARNLLEIGSWAFKLGIFIGILIFEWEIPWELGFSKKNCIAKTLKDII